MKTKLSLHNFRAALSLFALILAFSVGLNARADDWSLQDKDGTRHTLSGLHGKWVLINFWAPWCPPCLAEIPQFIEAQNQHKDLQVIGVAVMYRSKQEVWDVVNKLAISYPVVFGNEDVASDFGGISGLPTSFVYTPEGKLLVHHDGPLTRSEIEQLISASDHH